MNNYKTSLANMNGIILLKAANPAVKKDLLWTYFGGFSLKYENETIKKKSSLSLPFLLHYELENMFHDQTSGYFLRCSTS